MYRSQHTFSATHIFAAATESDIKNLATMATNALHRDGGDANSALLAFMNRLRISPEIRALVGIELIRNTAADFLRTQAALIQTDKHKVAPLGKGSGGFQGVDETQRGSGPAATIHVRQHDRHRPGNARHGLAEALAARALAPAAYSLELPDGRDYMGLRIREVKRIVPDSAFAACLSYQTQLYGQYDDESIVRDVMPVDVVKGHVALAKRYAKLVQDRVEITVPAFLAMETRHVGHMQAQEQAQEQAREVQPVPAVK